jgi:hypothetical protein
MEIKIMLSDLSLFIKKSNMKKIYCTVAGLLSFAGVYAQCDTTVINGNLIQDSDILMGGVYQVNGTFHLKPGTTIYVEPYSFGSCGKLVIIATKILVEGTINGDYAGYTGGTGGNGGSVISSLTGDITAINDCSNKDNSGQVTLEGGFAGSNGNGPGSGLSGNDGGDGSGPKQQCQNNNDEAGLIGSGGGAGGGGGASYGGAGSSGANGGSGTDFYTVNTVSVSPAFVVIAGAAGTGGNAGNTFGTETGHDIDLGSGGAGAGGGGRSYSAGLPGAPGGKGGGAVQLITTSDSLIFTGIISVNGEAGGSGGNGGAGGASPNCCSDGCDDCGEATLSCGSGAGSGAGGGSGGGVYFESASAAVITGAVSAVGGNGGQGGTKGLGASCSYGGNLFCDANGINSGDGNHGANGGAGGGGRIKIFVPLCSDAIITPTTDVDGGTGASAGTYAVVCSAVGVEEETAQSAFVVYPNPAQEQVSIRFSIPQGSVQAELVITDAMGRVVYTQNQVANDQEVVNITLNGLPSGLYFVNMVTEESVLIRKFIKQ